jgi:hypothetical protein
MSELADTRRDAPEMLDAPEHGADRLAARLRAEPVDAAALARAELRFVDAVRARELKKSAPRLWLGVGIAAACALAVAVVAGGPTSLFGTGDERRTVAGTVTPLRAGQVLDGREPVRGQLGHATLAWRRGARGRVVGAALHDASVRLVQGELFVDFRPLRRGEEHLAIDTPSARVEVVGTAFLVRVAADGATRVEVTHGIVEVLARATGVRRRLTANTSIDVGALVATAPRRAPAVQVPRAEETAPNADPVRTSPSGEASGQASPDTDNTDATGSRPAGNALPSLDAALAALDAGDDAPCERLAANGARAVRLDALEALADRHERRGAAEAAAAAYAKILALDPRGARGATALFARASLRERTGQPGAADDFARYLAEHPRGALAAQARTHLCALDPVRCPAP